MLSTWYIIRNMQTLILLIASRIFKSLTHQGIYVYCFRSSAIIKESKKNRWQCRSQSSRVFPNSCGLVHLVGCFQWVTHFQSNNIIIEIIENLKFSPDKNGLSVKCDPSWKYLYAAKIPKCVLLWNIISEIYFCPKIERTKLAHTDFFPCHQEHIQQILW